MRLRKRIVALIALAAVFLFVFVSVRKESSFHAGGSDGFTGSMNKYPSDTDPADSAEVEGFFAESVDNYQSGMDVSDPVGELTSSAVLIESGDLLGFGSIWEIADDTVTVITALHVIADQGDISVIFPDGAMLQAEVLERDPSKDYCFLKVVTGGDEARSQGKEVPSNGSAAQGKDHGLTSISPADSLPRAGQTVFMALPFSSESDTIGNVGLMPASLPDSVYVGTVINPRVYSQDFGMDVILCSIGVVEGMSGGGLFDEKGEYLGLLLGGNGDSAGVFLPVGDVVR